SVSGWKGWCRNRNWRAESQTRLPAVRGVTWKRAATEAWSMSWSKRMLMSRLLGTCWSWRAGEMATTWGAFWQAAASATSSTARSRKAAVAGPRRRLAGVGAEPGPEVVGERLQARGVDEQDADGRDLVDGGFQPALGALGRAENVLDLARAVAEG